MEIDLSRHAASGWGETFRAGGVRAHRRRGQLARRWQIQSLDQRTTAARSGRMVQGSNRTRGLLVAGLASLDHRARQGAGRGQGTGRRKVEGDRGRAWKLCEGAIELGWK